MKRFILVALFVMGSCLSSAEAGGAGDITSRVFFDIDIDGEASGRIGEILFVNLLLFRIWFVWR